MEYPFRIFQSAGWGSRLPARSALLDACRIQRSPPATRAPKPRPGRWRFWRTRLTAWLDRKRSLRFCSLWSLVFRCVPGGKKKIRWQIRCLPPDQDQDSILSATVIATIAGGKYGAQLNPYRKMGKTWCFKSQRSSMQNAHLIFGQSSQLESDTAKMSNTSSELT